MSEIELISFQIISNGGAAKSKYIEAIQCARKKDFEKSQEKIALGDELFRAAHKYHLELLQQESSGKNVVPTMLLTHAEDQLSSAETIKMLAKELIEVQKQFEALNNKKI